VLNEKWLLFDESFGVDRRNGCMLSTIERRLVRFYFSIRFLVFCITRFLSYSENYMIEGLNVKFSSSWFEVFLVDQN